MEPRNAATVAVVPVAFMAAIALHEVLLPGIAALQKAGPQASPPPYLKSTAVRAAVVYLAFFVLEFAFLAGTHFADVRVSEANRTAFAWVAANTPPDSRFLVITGDNELFCDPVQEWFPALAHRDSQTTLQGQEWNTSGIFFSKIAGLPKLQACIQAASPIDCLGTEATSLGLQYDYIYVAEAGALKRFCRPLQDERRGAALVMQLESQYTAAYATQDVKIFAVGR